MSFADRKSSENNLETVGKDRNATEKGSGRSVYEFGPYRLDPAGRRLLLDGEPVALTARVFDILLYFVQNGGRLITKEEVLSAVWPDSFVEEGNLTRNVSTLRKALGDNSDDPRYIVTLPGRGYTFVPVVREVWESDEPEAMPAAVRLSSLPVETTAADPVAPALPRARQAHRLRLLLAFGVVGLTGLLLYSWFRRTSTTSETASIAVLPFKPLAADARDESLELGMADTIIARLSQVRGITVRPVSSVRRYSSLEQDALAAGRELGVSSVLDGSLQKAGERIRVRLRLLRVSDGRQLWAGQFDERMSDIFAVQDSISEKVVATLIPKLSEEDRQRLAKRDTGNAEAWRLYINGRFYWNNKRTAEGFNRAVEYFEQAIREDPKYALAHAGLADAYTLRSIFAIQPPAEAYPKARAVALRALELDDHLAEAHAALAHVKAQFEYDWSGAEKELRQALALNPHYAWARHLYAHLLATQGRFDEGLSEMKQAQELEPLSLYIHANVGMLLYYARRYDEAITQLKKTLEMDAGLDHARSLLGRAYLSRGMYEEGIAEFRQRTTPTPGSFGDTGMAYALAGRRSEARKEIEKLQQLSQQRYVPPYDLAVIYASLDDRDKAFEWLEQAYTDRSQRLIYLQQDPALDQLRSDPRYKQLARRLGFTF
jgi:TolB-like protein/DNA-binding winged helix-turn-helix (wHTH) protein/Flp pilus assembly protein TadD